MHLSKNYLGIGIVGLPYAFSLVGYLLGTFLMLIIMVIVYYSSTLLLDICNDFNKPKITY